MFADEELRALLRNADALRLSSNSTLRDSVSVYSKVESLPSSVSITSTIAPSTTNSTRKYIDKRFSTSEYGLEENYSKVVLTYFLV